MTEAERWRWLQRVRELLLITQQAQKQYWEALERLEQASGLEFAEEALEGTTAEELLEIAEGEE
jgi:hypothetical protein